MKIGGAKTEKEFYEMYPTEEAFLMKHGGAISKLMAAGGEAYPQTSTMDNFFSYGVPVPPTYYAHGGAFPMAQAENQFFSPFYGKVPNPYNKAMGGSSESTYGQAMSFPDGDTGKSTHFMMADGGYIADEEQLPKMGVDGELTNFLVAVKNTATNKVNDNLIKHGKTKNREQYLFEQGISEYGGNIRRYQSKINSAQTDPILDRIARGTRGDSPIFKPLDLPQIDANSDKGTASTPATNNYYYGPQGTGMQLPPEFYNDIDYLYGRRRPLSDFNIKGRGIAGNYRSTGWLKDEYGMDALRQLGLTGLEETKGGLFKRPTKKYYFGQQGQGMGYIPGTVDQQGMPVNTPAAQTPGQQTPGATPDAPGASPKDRDKGPGFFDRLFNREGNIVPKPGSTTNVVPDQQVEGKERISERNYQMWNPEFTDSRNQRMQNRLKRTGKKLDDLEAFQAWQQDQLGNENIGLSGSRGRQYRRIDARRGRLEDKMTDYKGFVDPNMPTEKFGGQQEYQAKDTQGTVKTPSGREVPLNDHKRGEKTTFKGTMTVDEYLKRNQMSDALKQQIIDSNDPNIQWTPMQGVVDRQQVGNQPVGATTIIPLVVPPSSSNSKPSFYAPGADMFDGIEYVTPDSVDFDSTNTDHRAAMMRAILSGATDDSYDELLPSMKNKKYGGSHTVGDVVDMTPEELQKFIEMGGQVEFLD